jgi:CheY-like chemotaxis protein
MDSPETITAPCRANGQRPADAGPPTVRRRSEACTSQPSAQFSTSQQDASTLPDYSARPDALRLPIGRRRDTAGARDPLSTARILLADHDAAASALYRELFLSTGADVAEAADGREALVSALCQPPALLITDLRLPLLDGYALCEILRRDLATAKVPILVVTSDLRPASALRVRAAGADAVILKPASRGQLLAEARRLLVSRASRTLAGRDREVRAANERKRRKTSRRFETTTPALPSPSLACPRCDRPLAHHRSYVGGVLTRAEQWDEFECATCGRFEYRHRTASLRPVTWLSPIGHR